MKSVESKLSLQTIKPKTLSECGDFGSDDIKSESSPSPESYGALENIVSKTLKKRTRTNSQDGAPKQAKRKVKLIESHKSGKSLTLGDTISTNLTCRLKKFR